MNGSDGRDESAAAWLALIGVPAGTFDLVVRYLSLIDIADLPAAMVRTIAVPRPGSTLPIANLASFNTTSIPDGWTKEPDLRPHAGYAHTATEFDSGPDFYGCMPTCNLPLGFRARGHICRADEHRFPRIEIRGNFV